MAQPLCRMEHRICLSRISLSVSLHRMARLNWQQTCIANPSSSLPVWMEISIQATHMPSHVWWSHKIGVCRRVWAVPPKSPVLSYTWGCQKIFLKKYLLYLSFSLTEVMNLEGKNALPLLLPPNTYHKIHKYCLTFCTGILLCTCILNKHLSLL